MARDYGLRGGRGELGTCKWRKSQTATKIVVSEDIAAGVETTVDHPAIEEGHTHGRAHRVSVKKLETAHLFKGDALPVVRR
jgi:hypothetical protein